MKGRSVVALASLFQHSPLLLVTQDTKKFDNPDGLQGATVMVEPDAEEFFAFLRRNQLPIRSINVLDHDSPVAAFESKQIDAFTAYATDELFALNESQIPHRILSLTTAPLEHYSDVLFTSQELIERDPPTVRAFRRASIEGWRYAFEHIAEAIALIEDKYGVTKGVPALTFEAEEMLKRAKPASGQIGDMNVRKWITIANSYALLGMAPHNASIDGFVFGESYRSRGKFTVVSVASSFFVIFLVAFIILGDRLTALARKIIG
jgi:ABC-type nitrate/sulfonate/bicarbonate transport system substrate-binding protein